MVTEIGEEDGVEGGQMEEMKRKRGWSDRCDFF